MSILTGSARITNAALMERIAELEARLGDDAPKPKRGKAKMPAFVGKADRKAGKGHRCAAPEPCSRRDLRTASSTTSHTPDANGKHYHTAR